MLSLGSLSSAGGATAYYTGGQYYLESGALSQWAGGAKLALNLPNGPVKPDDLNNMLAGKLPNGQQLGKMVKGELQRAPGIDMTFSMSKSASILLNGPNGAAIQKLQIESVIAGMDAAEKYVAQTRASGKTTGDQKIVYAMFHETTSRANDPNGHTHAVVPNITLDADGKFRSMHNNAIWTNRNVIGAAYRAHFAKGFREMGYELRPAGKNGLFEIKGVDQKVIDLFSKRTDQMDRLEKQSKAPVKDRSQLVLISRPPKEHMSAEELKIRWNKELYGIDTSFSKIDRDARDATRGKSISTSQVLDNAIRDLSETKSEWTHLDLFRAALTNDIPHATLNELEVELDDQVKSGKILQDKSSTFFTTPKMQRSRQAVINEWKAGRLQGDIIASKTLGTDNYTNSLGLTKGQIDSGNIVLASRDRIVGIQGSAGSGKTTLLKSTLPMLKQAMPVVRQSGKNIIGIAPSAAAVRELDNTGVFDKTMTVQQFVLTPRGDKNTVLIMDEASMVGLENMRQVLNFANKKKMARVVLMGDVKQLKSVGAGRPFSDLQTANMRTAKLDEIVRQKNSRHKEAITALAKDDIKKGMEMFSPEIHEFAHQDMNAHAVELWSRSNNPKTAIIVQTNAQKAELNQQIKSKLTKPNTPQSTSFKIWRPVHRTKRQKTLTNTYHDVSHIRFNRDVKKLRIRRGEIFKVSHVNDNRCTVTLSKNGRSKTFKPAKHGGGKSVTELYKQDHIFLDKGDRIRFTRGGRNKIVNNNDMGFIRGIKGQSVSVELDNGKTVQLNERNTELRHIDHAWANTAHSFQGKTVDKAIVVMPSRSSPVTTLEGLYVGMSRHKLDVALITDNASRLQTNLQDALEINAKAMTVFPLIEHELQAELSETRTPTHSEEKEEDRDHTREIERATRNVHDYGR